MIRFLLVSLVLLAISGCASAAPPAPLAFRPCTAPSTTDYYLHGDTRFTRPERDALYRAAAQWSEASCVSTILVTFDNPHPERWEADATAGRRALVRGLELAPPEPAAGHDGLTVNRMTVFVGPHERFHRLALHEFGHLLGLEHDGPGTVMRQDVSEGSDEITEDDFAQCVAKGACAP